MRNNTGITGLVARGANMDVEESEPWSFSGSSQSNLSVLRCPKPSELARKRKTRFKGAWTYGGERLGTVAKGCNSESPAARELFQGSMDRPTAAQHATAAICTSKRRTLAGESFEVNRPSVFSAMETGIILE